MDDNGRYRIPAAPHEPRFELDCSCGYGLAALDGLASLEAEDAIPAGQVFGPDGWGDAATWSAVAERPEAEQ